MIARSRSSPLVRAGRRERSDQGLAFSIVLLTVGR
jgi:hypothetical protein